MPRDQNLSLRFHILMTFCNFRWTLLTDHLCFWFSLHYDELKHVRVHIQIKREIYWTITGELIWHFILFMYYDIVDMCMHIFGLNVKDFEPLPVRYLQIIFWCFSLYYNMLEHVHFWNKREINGSYITSYAYCYGALSQCFLSKFTFSITVCTMLDKGILKSQPKF